MKSDHYKVKIKHITWNLTTLCERVWNFDCTSMIWSLWQTFGHSRILHFVSPEEENWYTHQTILVVDFFLTAVKIRGKKNQFVKFTKMPVSLVQFELYQWYFGDNHSLQRGIRKKYLDFWRWVQPAQPSQSAYQITRPDTRLFQLCVGGQGPYLRSAWHLGRSSMV